MFLDLTLLCLLMRERFFKPKLISVETDPFGSKYNSAFSSFSTLLNPDFEFGLVCLCQELDIDSFSKFLKFGATFFVEFSQI